MLLKHTVTEREHCKTRNERCWAVNLLTLTSHYLATCLIPESYQREARSPAPYSAIISAAILCGRRELEVLKPGLRIALMLCFSDGLFTTRIPSSLHVIPIQPGTGALCKRQIQSAAAISQSPQTSLILQPFQRVTH